MRRRAGVMVVLAALAAPAALAGPVLGAPAASAASTASTASTGDVYVVQGLLDSSPDIYVDGDRVLAKADPKTVVGPLHLDAGSHSVSVRSGGKAVARSRFRVGAGQSLDVVAHLRSDAEMGATVTAYRNDLAPVAPGKLRLAVAHVAAAPAADIEVDGRTLFSNVSAGEALAVTVPAKRYTLQIVPAATAGDPILGPVDVTLKKGTLTRVFAIGNVTTGDMDAVVHRLPVGVSGAGAPRSVPTGDGGQAASELLGTGSRASDLLMGTALAFLAAAAGIAGVSRRVRQSRAAVPARR